MLRLHSLHHISRHLCIELLYGPAVVGFLPTWSPVGVGQQGELLLSNQSGAAQMIDEDGARTEPSSHFLDAAHIVQDW
jgi:hypothetical protein